MRPDREPRRPDGGELLDEVAEVLGPVRDGAEGVVLRQRRERRRDLLLDLGCEQAERLGARLLGREVRVVVVGRERRVEAGRDLAEPPGALGQPGRVVVERPEGDLPAPTRGRDERGERRERRLERRPLGRQRPLEPRGVGEAGRGERVEHLELGVRPCLEAGDRASARGARRARRSCSTARRRAGERGHPRPGPRRATRASRRPPAARMRRPPRRRRPARRDSARASPSRTGPRRSRASPGRPRRGRRRPRRPPGRGPSPRTTGPPSRARGARRSSASAGHASEPSSWRRNQKNPRGPKVRK